MRSQVKITTFILVVIYGYAAFANSIPQIESRPPEEAAGVELVAGMAGDELVLAGEEIFNSKGVCLACHGLGAPGPRAPDLARAALEASDRLAGAGYTGAATDVEGYLLESIVEPRLYAAPGYEPMGANITAVLSTAEIKAIVAFLESFGGEVTMVLSEEDIVGSRE